MNKVCIAGLGIYEGPKVKEEQWIERVRDLYGPIMDKVSKNPGIEWRQLHDHEELKDIETRNNQAGEIMLKMCTLASLGAMKDAGIEAKDITHIIWVSSTWIGAPAMDLQLSATLGLDPRVIRIPIMMAGCSGGGVGLHTAWHIVQADEKALCLLVASDIASPWLEMESPGDPNLAIANTIFSDGAGAMIIGSKGKARLSRPTSYLVPGTMDRMAIKVKNEGLYPRLSPTIHIETSKTIPYILELLHIDDPVQYLVHPGGKSILTAIGHREKMDASWHVLENYGNMSSASIIYVIAQIWNRANNDGSYPIITFGQGLHIAAIRLDKNGKESVDN